MCQTQNNYILRKRAEPVIMTALTQRRRKIVRKFLDGAKKAESNTNDLLVERESAHSADNRRYYLMSRRSDATYVRESPFREMVHNEACHLSTRIPASSNARKENVRPITVAVLRGLPATA